MDRLSPRYGVASLCGHMGVGCSGHCKWRKTPPSARALGCARMLVLVGEAHQTRRTHGYRWIAACLRNEAGMGETTTSYASAAGTCALSLVQWTVHPKLLVWGLP